MLVFGSKRTARLQEDLGRSVTVQFRCWNDLGSNITPDQEHCRVSLGLIFVPRCFFIKYSLHGRSDEVHFDRGRLEYRHQGLRRACKEIHKRLGH